MTRKYEEEEDYPKRPSKIKFEEEEEEQEKPLKRSNREEDGQQGITPVEVLDAARGHLERAIALLDNLR